MKKVLVRKDSYYDSVFLMLVNQEAKKLAGVSEAVVAMGTPMNRDLLAGMGFASAELAAATPNDLVIAVEAATAQVAAAGLEEARGLLSRRAAAGGGDAAGHRPATLDAALRAAPRANVAVVSLPGAYAAREARRALLRGLHVMLFSDNVSLEDEIALKRLARERGLLMMGPDCGTAIINGRPLCFANVVRRGSIGIVAASGTGLQECSCCIDSLGGGVSQAIGTGGRDLKNERVGGLTMLAGIEALARDPATRVIVVISKPPAASVAARVTEALAAAGKPAVVHFVGFAAPAAAGASAGVRYAASLEHAAVLAVALAGGRSPRPRTFTLPEADVAAVVARESRAIASRQRWLRGLFTGGTLADEALFALNGLLGGVYSNNQTDPALLLPDARVSKGHTIVDLGDDVFTVGRPHPMIDPSIRAERLAEEARDPALALVLLDLVLGYGSHADPAGALAPAIREARAAAARRGGYLPVIASVTGTPGDFQGLDAQKAALEAAGVVVMPSNYQAVMLAFRIMERLAERGRAPGRAAAAKPAASKPAPGRAPAKVAGAKRSATPAAKLAAPAKAAPRRAAAAKPAPGKTAAKRPARRRAAARRGKR